MSKKDDKSKKGADKGKKAPDKGKAAAPQQKKAGKDKQKAQAKPTVETQEAPEEVPEPRLRQRYKQKITPALTKQFGYKNPMQVPRLDKIIVNVGLGDAVQNPKILDNAVAEVAAITGQKPIITRARKSIASFKLREGMPIGVRVTLRRERMWEFMDRLVSLSLPRVRDFRGISRKAFDGAGNYTLGLKEQIVFPEVDFDKVDHNHGMNITFVTSAKTNEEARELLGKLGMPFRN
jgi:large subunit ribosomal protein L5